jgi:hypothetical protein
MNCGICGKSTKFHRSGVGDMLEGFRYCARLGFSPGADEFEESKMAATQTEKSLNCHNFVNN